jgi:hypothetical protein
MKPSAQYNILRAFRFMEVMQLLIKKRRLNKEEI